ncbi:MAG: hypothetical protein NT155_03180 [Candidatus Staskawiczbacteria bacterium]|nr:hypothetical protein [Candidatus Staskawiczbacteria bacterium]
MKKLIALTVAAVLLGGIAIWRSNNAVSPVVQPAPVKNTAATTQPKQLKPGVDPRTVAELKKAGFSGEFHSISVK